LKGRSFVSPHPCSEAKSSEAKSSEAKSSEAKNYFKSGGRARAGSTLAVIVLASLFASPALAESGASLYKARCAACHGPKGAGDTMIGKNLNLRPLASEEVHNQSDDELFNIISRGKKKRMPSYGDKLSKDQIFELIRYIRGLKQ
jgi:cytochrome c6